MKRKIIPPKKLLRYKWGGTTFEWAEEAKEINAQIQDAQEENISKEKLKKEIEHANIPQYWN
ncbi:MAG: hypothetical protein N4A48_10900 [Tepidibacter sp.]|jgi:hypothetical protein|uniref:hypothetical protein n=1 Tax=Tepidibacter sp. TaxID=2529387 RepID=UPI0025E6E167|nr:hypothetical protein [Tepidibacter sp.]MCT4509238.1 hypothetical protein [Tepidibacter sp.]